MNGREKKYTGLIRKSEEKKPTLKSRRDDNTKENLAEIICEHM
jgi:hypothetical protein